MDNPRLYNIRVFRPFLEYIEQQYPNVDTSAILMDANIKLSEFEDDGYWVTQEQSDLFYLSIVQRTGRDDIAREAGRFMATSSSEGAMRDFANGFITPALAYTSVAHIASKLGRGMEISTHKIGTRKVEFIARPMPGMHEKPYQCQNRHGLLEALAFPFTGKYGVVDHPECFHKGDSCCRYIITWESTPAFTLKRIRNYLVVFLFFTCIALSLYLTIMSGSVTTKDENRVAEGS